MRIKSALKKILKFILYASLAIIFFIGCTIVFVRYGIRDIPRIDDSDMNIAERKISDNENAYTSLIKIAGSNGSNYNDPVIKKRKKRLQSLICEFSPGSKQFNEGVKVFSKELEAIDRISEMKHSRDIELVKHNKMNDIRNDDLASLDAMAILNLSKLQLIIADRDFANSKKDVAFDNTIKISKLGHLVEQPDGNSNYSFSLMIGLAMKRLALLSVNKFLDSGYLPNDYKHTMNELFSINESPVPWIDAFKREYYFRCLILDDVPQKEVGFINSVMLKKERVRRVFRDMFSANISNMQKKSVAEITPFNPTFSLTGNNRTDFFHKLYILGSNFYLYNLFLMFDNALYNTAIHQKFYSDSLIDMTRLRIAILGYKKDHGALPSSLKDLTPKYIEALPYDRFDGRSIRYDKERKIIYSVGTNLKDDKGASGKYLSEENSWNIQRKQEDIVLKIEK